MASCKDCIHEEICDMPIITDGRKNASNCKKFKNKADFVEVVRCKDCKRYSTELRMCLSSSGIMNAKPKDFCSYGERKDAE